MTINNKMIKTYKLLTISTFYQINLSPFESTTSWDILDNSSFTTLESI